MKSNTQVVTVTREVTHITLEPLERESLRRLLTRVGKSNSILFSTTDKDLELMNSLRTICGLEPIRFTPENVTKLKSKRFNSSNS